jgi:hypothetical protein
MLIETINIIDKKKCLYLLIVVATCSYFIFTESIYDDSELGKTSYLKFSSQITRPRYNISCERLFKNDTFEQSKALEILRMIRNGPTNMNLLQDSNFIFNRSMCNLYREIRGYDKHKVADSEREFPLAFIILVDSGVEQFQRLLRTIYRPHNIYCIHVDKKSSNDTKQAVQSIVDCFDNVFLPTQQESVYYAHYTILKAQFNCMSDLLNLSKLIRIDKHPNLIGKKEVKWKYLMNSAATFFPIRTNLELTRIFRVYNGSSDINIEQKHIHQYRYRTSWKLNGTNMVDTGILKTNAPNNYTVAVGTNYIAASRDYVNALIKSKETLHLFDWLKDVLFPV